MFGRDLLVGLAVVVVVLSGAFAVPVQSSDLEPVPFEDTVTLGMTGAVIQQSRAEETAIPKVQVYYSGYEYVVGYYGLESYVVEQRRTGHDRQFGRPLAVFVTDFTDTGAALTEEGYLTIEPGRVAGFVPARDTFVVVGSRARVPTGPVSVPFSERSAAEAFAAEHGGDVVPWPQVQDRLDPADRLGRERFAAAVSERSTWANETVGQSRTLRDRPVSVVVGEDEPTLAAALAAAPPNTTVRLPPGTYTTSGLTVEKPLTVDGAGSETLIRGDENGTVLRVDAEAVAITDLRIDGVGPVGSRSASEAANETADRDSGWSEKIELAYGRGDAAVAMRAANGSLVENVRIDTPSNGIIVRRSSGVVVRNLTLYGTAKPHDGFMGVVAMYDPIVVEDSRFVGGRDGVYTHRADGTVVRDNRMSDGRFGIHQMYTSEALFRNNTIRNESVGVVLMTRPVGNLVVGNDVRYSHVGIASAGSDSYYAENVLVANERGLDVSGKRSLYTHNTVVGNRIGLRGSTLLPTNHVTANDVVGNERVVESDLGPLRVWTVEGAGNYWGPMPATDRDGDGHYERAFRPTGAVDARLHDAPGARTLARSPAIGLIREVQGAVPGLRSTGVVDSAPRVRPARPEVLADARAAGTWADREGAA
jgi:nitrous oxidase accessory protein NosD/nitrous oxide reductase accessory protein NosL